MHQNYKKGNAHTNCMKKFWYYIIPTSLVGKIPIQRCLKVSFTVYTILKLQVFSDFSFLIKGFMEIQSVYMIDFQTYCRNV